MSDRYAFQEKRLMNTDSRDHRLFKQYPLNGRPRFLPGRISTPYHVYDGYGVFIGGTVDLAATQRLLSHETITPVRTSDGSSFMGIWVCSLPTPAWIRIMSCSSRFLPPTRTWNQSPPIP